MGSNFWILIISFLMLIDGLCVFIFPKFTKKFLKKFKKDDLVKLIAVWEIIFAIIILLAYLF